MDQIGASIKKEQHEFVNMTVVKCEMSENAADLIEDEKDGPALREPCPVKAGTSAISGRVEVEHSRQDLTTYHDIGDFQIIHVEDIIKEEPGLGNRKANSAKPMNIIDTMEEPPTYIISSDSSETEADEERRDETYKEGSRKSARKETKSRRPPVKNAREFFARLREKEKLLEQEPAKKSSKTQHGSGKAKVSKRLASDASSDTTMLAQLQQDIQTGESIRESVATSMPKMSASTHAEQLAIMAKSIPHGSDIRRSRTQKRDLKMAVKSFGYKVVKAHDGDWLHEKMLTPLYNHQVTATSWMMGRELAEAGPPGGLIADEMGMGKTLISLMCVVGNPADGADQNQFLRTTLVIVPNLAVAGQWKQEAKRHLSRAIGDKVLIYNAKFELSPEIIQQHWIM
ncbi:hypothetical protein E4U41_007054 [Claviceps citrina]|nr:hypothetical protein E4U41_007054 [Claviceps citrina]